MIVPTKEIKIYPNNKSSVTKDIKKLINKRKLAFKNKDSEAKLAHRKHLEDAFRTNYSKKVLVTMKSMTGMSSASKFMVTDN